VRVVIAKSIERIHKANLINFCIVPIEFAEPNNYDKIETGDKLVINDLLGAIKNRDEVRIAKTDGSFEFVGRLELSTRDREVLLAGGRLSFTRESRNLR
ncbi:MAG TPA: hypothetical protein VJJ98_05130, partial [Sedimentisphaerales bacterium]|nr:hypothetical protein [Sedimentisphaerales bacterium]